MTSKLLIGAKSICIYLNFSRPTFYKWVNRGLPAKLIDRRWHATTDNLDRFFNRQTGIKNSCQEKRV